MSSSPDYRELFEATSRTAIATDWLPQLKISAIEQFEAVGFPTTRDEDWHFTSVTPIAERMFKPARAHATALTAHDIAPFTYGQDAWHLLVFVNGHFEPSLSSFAQLDASARVMTFTEALKEAPDLLAERLGTLAPKAHAFTALNTAFLSDGVVIHVPADVALDLDLEVLLGSEICHAWSFWSGEYLGLIRGGHVFGNLGAHSGILLRLTPVATNPALPLLVGSDLHITTGAVELREVRATHERMEIVLDESAGATNGSFVVICSALLKLTASEGIGEVGVSASGPGVWRVALKGRRKAAQRIVLNVISGDRYV